MRRRPQAELLTIGTELLTGSVTNTNAAFLGRELTELGFQVSHQMSCRDEFAPIGGALRLALNRSDLIFVTGGLGPTPDDITRESLAKFFGVPLVFSQPQYREILSHYRKRGRKVPPLVRREAYFPENSKPIFNRFGIALGFRIEQQGKVVIVLPGVPGELVRLFEVRLKPFLKKRFPNLRPPAVLIVKTIGLSEPTVMRRLGRAFFKLGDFQFGIYPEVGEAALRIYADSQGLLTRLKRRILQVMERDIYSFSEDKIEAVIGKKLRSRNWSLSIAESCTGGRVSEWITKVPGASRYFSGAVVAYQNEIKSKLLGVSPSLIETKGAVSREAALSMAEGIRDRFGSTLGIAVTGIAGPTGATREKPVGLVYLAIAGRGEHRTWEGHFRGDRIQIQNRAAKKLLEYLWRWLTK